MRRLVRKSACVSGFDLFSVLFHLASHFSYSLNIVTSHLLNLVQLAPCGFNGICATPLEKKKKKRFAALGTRVDAPQCLIRVIRLAASAPHTSQTALPYKTRRLIPLCKTTLRGQKFYSGTCARMSCLISAEVWHRSRGRDRKSPLRKRSRICS